MVITKTWQTQSQTIKTACGYSWLSAESELKSQEFPEGFRFTVGLLTLVLVWRMPGDRVGVEC